MQLLRVLVPDEHRSKVFETLDEKDFDYVVVAGGDRFETDSIVEVPVSEEGIGDVTDSLEEVGIDLGRYLVVEELQQAVTPNGEEIRERYVDVYDRPSGEELRSLVDRLNWDLRSFLAMMSLSAIVAAIGLVLDSPVVVVGAAVIAPLVNPMLITAIGTVLGERRMLRDSLRLQAAGLAVAVTSAFAVGLIADGAGVVPSTLELTALDAVKARFAPSVLVVLVGIVTGAAAAISLTAEENLINIVGVMVAAALIPAAAASGVALARGELLVAFGSAVLLVATVVAINLAALGTLLLLGYRPSRSLFAVPSRRTALRVATAALLLGGLLVTAGGATADQLVFERNVNGAVDDVVSDREDLSVVVVHSEYADYSPFTGPETVVVEVSRTDGEAHPDLANRIADRIAAETGRTVSVRIEFVDRQESSNRETST